MNFKKRVNGSWADTPHYIHNTSTDTLTTLPADIYANDTTATVGLKGNMEQNGTPTPTTPIQPSECGEMTGNLCGIAEQTITFTNLTVRAKDNTITFEGNNFRGEIYGNNTKWETLSFTLPAGTYCINKTPRPSSFNGMMVYVYNEDGERIASPEDGRRTFTLAEETTCHLGFYVYLQQSEDTYTYNVMLNTGSTALPYEPYGYKIPILNNSQTTNVYLGEVQTTRRIKKLVFTGQETWAATTDSVYIDKTNFSGEPALGSSPLYCSHYPNDNTGMIMGNSWWFRCYDSTSVLNWKTYLQQQYAAGTPVIVWYVLATPTTGIVNEPLRKIGTYADEVSSITIPTIAGANTLSIDTTLPPSEVTTTYKGWHPVADVHEAENGQWD